MTVIEPPNKEKVEVIEFNQANEECKHCPCCNALFYGKKSSITREEYTITKKHMFYIQTHKVMRYNCSNCGCKYESEPYNYKAYSIMDDDNNEIIISILTILGFIIGFLIACLAAYSFIFLIVGCSLIILIDVYLYLCFNYYKKYNKNKFKPYKVYKKMGDK